MDEVGWHYLNYHVAKYKQTPTKPYIFKNNDGVII